MSNFYDGTYIKKRIESRCPVSLKDFAEHTQIIDDLGYDSDACLLVAKNFKQRAQYLGDAVAQMFMRQEAKSSDKGLAVELGVLAQTFSYLLNSQSFRDGKLHDFDRSEIESKLRRIVRERSL